jgi:hypothetical protein
MQPRHNYKRVSKTSWECAVDVDEACKDPLQANSTQCKQHRHLELQSCERDPITLQPIPHPWLIRLYLLYEDSHGRQERTLRCFDVRTLQIYIAEVPSAGRAFTAAQLQRIKSFRPASSSSDKASSSPASSSSSSASPTPASSDLEGDSERQAMYTWLINGQKQESESNRVKLKHTQAREIKQLLAEQQKEEALYTHMSRASPDARRIRRAQHIDAFRRMQSHHREQERVLDEHAALRMEQLLRELPTRDLDAFLAQWVY